MYMEYSPKKTICWVIKQTLKCKRIEIKQSVFPDGNGFKPEINNRTITETSSILGSQKENCSK